MGTAPLLLNGGSSVCARSRGYWSVETCKQMDGLELSALNDINDAHGKLLSWSLGRKRKLLAEGHGAGQS